MFGHLFGMENEGFTILLFFFCFGFSFSFFNFDVAVNYINFVFEMEFFV